MDKCFLFFCLPIVMVEDLKPPGTVLWDEGGWQVMIVIRNEDTTDRGCRLVYKGEKGGRLELDAYFLAGKFLMSLSLPLLTEGPANLGIFGLTPEGDTWGLTSVASTMTKNEIVADVPGQSVASLLQDWSDRGVGELAIFDVDGDKWLGKVGIPNLADASTAFLDCYDTVPTGQQ
jgi:hypothetical protein